MVTSSIARSEKGIAFPTRRKVLAGCVGLTATAALSPWAARATSPYRRGELFAFAAPDRDDVVVALAMDPRSLGKVESGRPNVRLHVGDRYWTLEPSVGGRAIHALLSGERLFSGPVSRFDHREAVAQLFVVALPAERLPQKSLDVWAEVIGPGGAHSRVGNPVVSQLLADDPQLARLHARLHPAMDRSSLSAAVARSISARSDESRDPDTDARAKRLAGLILPDTLRFHPTRPGGFTFAAMNGRGPEDAVDHVVQSILAGAPQVGRSDVKYRPSSQFPYFASPIAA
jgi:hypothetical protein